MDTPPDIMAHPVFGDLRWEQPYDWWFAQVRQESGEWLDVILEPGEEDPMRFLESATHVFHRALRAEVRLRTQAIREKLRALFNDGWRRADEAALTEDKFCGVMALTLIHISGSTTICVELSYEVGDLFGGHGPTLELDHHLKLRRIDLRG